MSTQLSLFVACERFEKAPAQRESATSVAAAEAIEPNVATLRGHVLAILRLNGPMTDEAICEALSMNPSTERPRRIELVRSGLVASFGETVTRSGRRATLWAAR